MHLTSGTSGILAMPPSAQTLRARVSRQIYQKPLDNITQNKSDLAFGAELFLSPHIPNERPLSDGFSGARSYGRGP